MSTSPSLDGAAVAFLVANEGVEQVELTEPWKAVEAAGGRPVLIAPELGKVQAYDHLDPADSFTPDLAVDQADVAHFAALVLPGGVANPDQLRTSRPAVDFTKAFFEVGKPVAAICHAPWMLVEADVVDGRTVTSWPSLQTDLKNAGAEWVNEEVVVDTDGAVLITSRNPDDLPAFNRALIQHLS